MSLFFPVVSFRIVKTNDTVQSNSSVNACEKRNNERAGSEKYRGKESYVLFSFRMKKLEKNPQQ